MRYILVLITLAMCVSANTQPLSFGNNAAIYLVRHAEKETGSDPVLTAEGNKRAGDLARILTGKKVARIYVTEYRRTQNTGDSLRIQMKIDTVHYSSDTSCIDLFNKIRSNRDLNNPIVIIGHSNTIPIIIDKLVNGKFMPKLIPDDEFDNLYLVTYHRSTPGLKVKKYGKISGASAKMK